MRKTTLFADITLLLVALIWGSTFVIVQNAIAFLEPFTFNAVRFSIASLLLICWLLLFQRKQVKACSRKLIFAGILIGFWLFIGYASQTVGLLYTLPLKLIYHRLKRRISSSIFSVIIKAKTEQRSNFWHYHGNDRIILTYNDRFCFPQYWG